MKSSPFLKEKKVIQELPDEFKILKMDIMDYVFSKAQADYYFSLLLGLDIKRSQRRTEELFKRGALIKIHSEKDNKPKFYPTPPTFIFFVDELGIEMVKKHKKAIEKLEDLYYQKYCNVKDSFLKQKLMFFTIKGSFFRGFKYFIIKKFMKEEGYLTYQYLEKDAYEQDKLALGDPILKKLTVILAQTSTAHLKNYKAIITVDKEDLGRERIVVIDNCLIINFFSLINTRGNQVFTGYLSKDERLIKSVKNRVLKLRNKII